MLYPTLSRNAFAALALCAFTLLTAIGCGTGVTLEPLDLNTYHIPLSIKVPKGAKAEQHSDDNLFEDVVVKQDSTELIQILGFIATTPDIKQAISVALADKEKEPMFSKVLEQDESGFLYEIKEEDSKMGYGFLRIKIVNDREYHFQEGFATRLTKDKAKMLFDAVR